MELATIKVENLVPESCQGDISSDEFMKRLEKHGR